MGEGGGTQKHEPMGFAQEVSEGAKKSFLPPGTEEFRSAYS